MSAEAREGLCKNLPPSGIGLRSSLAHSMYTQSKGLTAHNPSSWGSLATVGSFGMAVDSDPQCGTIDSLKTWHHVLGKDMAGTKGYVVCKHGKRKLIKRVTPRVSSRIAVRREINKTNEEMYYQVNQVDRKYRNNVFFKTGTKYSLRIKMQERKTSERKNEGRDACKRKIDKVSYNTGTIIGTSLR